MTDGLGDIRHLQLLIVRTVIVHGLGEYDDLLLGELCCRLLTFPANLLLFVIASVFVVW